MLMVMEIININICVLENWILISIGICVLYESYIVSFEHNPAECFPGLGLGVVLLGVVQHQVHVLVETDNVSFYSEVNVLKEPHLDPGTILQVPEDQVDGLHHHFLHFLRPLVRHFPRSLFRYLIYLIKNNHSVTMTRVIRFFWLDLITGTLVDFGARGKYCGLKRHRGSKSTVDKIVGTKYFELSSINIAGIL